MAGIRRYTQQRRRVIMAVESLTNGPPAKRLFVGLQIYGRTSHQTGRNEQGNVDAIHWRGGAAASVGTRRYRPSPSARLRGVGYDPVSHHPAVPGAGGGYPGSRVDGGFGWRSRHPAAARATPIRVPHTFPDRSGLVRPRLPGSAWVASAISATSSTFCKWP